jgi:hypothetical protein
MDAVLHEEIMLTPRMRLDCTVYRNNVAAGEFYVGRILPVCPGRHVRARKYAVMPASAPACVNRTYADFNR